MNISFNTNISQDIDLIVIIHSLEDAKEYANEAEFAYLRQKFEQQNQIVQLNQLKRNLFFVWNESKKNEFYQIKEEYRIIGYDLFQLIAKEKIEHIQLTAAENNPEIILALAEGFALSSYQFLKYKSDKKEHSFKSIILSSKDVNKKQVEELSTLIEANFISRNLVNEPVIYLTAEKLAEEVQKLGKDAGFQVEVFHQDKIASLKMNGLLTVNKGSKEAPTFSVLEYKPKNAQNKNPYILVGKGVVFDTGGLSLKPTPHSMDYMKCDMAGAATVAGTIYALTKNKLPIYVVGLIPATDNRPGYNAVAPGDVIQMMNNKSVEILNTDAEGRLILADALCFATKYKPELVIDLATLTGAAVRAIGHEATAMMGTATTESKNKLQESGLDVFERLVEFPLWDEYEEHIKSDIADINNLGRAEAGAITAGKFLQHFTDYPWIHLDIAGTAYLHAPDKYRGKGGTGTGVRLLYHFFKKLLK